MRHRSRTSSVAVFSTLLLLGLLAGHGRLSAQDGATPEHARVESLGEAAEFGQGHSVTLHELRRGVEGEIGMMGQTDSVTATTLDVEICAGSSALNPRVVQAGNFGLWLPRSTGGDVYKGRGGRRLEFNGEPTFGLAPGRGLDAGECARGLVLLDRAPRGEFTAAVFDTRAFSSSLPDDQVVFLAFPLEND